MQLIVNAKDKEEILSYLNNEVCKKLSEGFTSGHINSETNWDLVEEGS